MRRSAWLPLLLSAAALLAAAFAAASASAATTTIFHPTNGSWTASSSVTLDGFATAPLNDSRTFSTPADFAGGTFDNTTAPPGGGLSIAKNGTTFRYAENFSGKSGLGVAAAGAEWTSADYGWNVGSNGSSVLAGSPSAALRDLCPADAWWRALAPGPILNLTLSFRYGVTGAAGARLLVGLNYEGVSSDALLLVNASGSGQSDRMYGGDLTALVAGRSSFFLHFRAAACSSGGRLAFDDLQVNVTVADVPGAPAVTDLDDFSLGLRAAWYRPMPPGESAHWDIAGLAPADRTLGSAADNEGSIYYRVATLAPIVSAEVTFWFDCQSPAYLELYLSPGLGQNESLVMQAGGSNGTYSGPLEVPVGQSAFVLRLWARGSPVPNACRMDDFNLSVASDAAAPGFARGSYVSAPIAFDQPTALRVLAYGSARPPGSSTAVAVRTASGGSPWTAWISVPNGSVPAVGLASTVQFRVDLDGADMLGYADLAWLRLQFAAITGVELSIDGGASWRPCTTRPADAVGNLYWNLTLTLPPGLTVVWVRTNDTVGPGVPVIIALGYDGIPPTAPGTPVAPLLTGNPSLSWNWTPATDIGLGIALYRIRLGTSDGGGEVLNNTSVALALAYGYPSGADGTRYSFAVRACDRALLCGPWSPSATTVVDLTGPSAPSAAGPSGWVAGTSASWDWTAASDPSGVASYQVVIARDALGNDSRLTAATGELHFSLTDGAQNSPYYFFVRGVDALGHVGALSLAVGPLFFDDTAPTSPIGVHAPASPTNQLPLAWSWEGASDSGSGLVGFEVALGAEPGGSDLLDWTAVPGPAFELHAALSGVQYFASVRAIDAVGHRSLLAAAADPGWADLEAPPAPDLLEPPSPTSLHAAVFTWQRLEDPGGAGVAGYYYDTPSRYDQSSHQLPGSALSVALNGTDRDTLRFRIRAFDRAGNLGNWSQVVAVVFDWTAPGPPTGLVAVVAGTNVTLTFHLPDRGPFDFAAFVVSVGTSEGAHDLVSDARVTNGTDSFSYSFTGKVGYLYYVRVAAVDPAGNVGPPASTTVRVERPSAGGLDLGMVTIGLLLGVVVAAGTAGAVVIARKRRAK